jgi:hypothetical protein
MTARAHYRFVLAIYPNSRGIAFGLFEGERTLIDWGIRGARYKHNHERHLAAVGDLFALYRPAVVVLQNMEQGSARRAERIRNLNADIAALATALGVSVCFYSRAQVREAFGQLKKATKEEIANAIAEEVPALGRHIPPPRKAWTSEHARMGIFDAAALALTFFSRNTDYETD